MNIFYLNLAVSILLIIVGFAAPPTGAIDGSVLSAVGLLLMFSVIEKIPEAIKAGRSVKIKKGDFSAEVQTATSSATDNQEDIPPDDKTWTEA